MRIVTEYNKKKTQFRRSFGAKSGKRFLLSSLAYWSQYTYIFNGLGEFRADNVCRTRHTSIYTLNSYKMHYRPCACLNVKGYGFHSNNNNTQSTHNHIYILKAPDLTVRSHVIPSWAKLLEKSRVFHKNTTQKHRHTIERSS